MRFRIVGLATAMVVLGMCSAQAKVINMGVIARAEVKAACERAGFASFGIGKPDANYGCTGTFATVDCTPDQVCHAIMSDVRPMTGNSLDYVLTYDRPVPAATIVRPMGSSTHMVKPLNARLQPLTPPPPPVQ